MRYLITLFILLNISCKDIEVVQEDIREEVDTLTVSIVGSDKDSFGCLVTAGYTWSVLKQECVRLFELAYVLTPVQLPQINDAVLVCYVLLSADGLKAEVFFPGEEESIIFNRPVISQPWEHQNWTLIADEGFKLYDNQTLKFSGDNEPGPKVTGSDKIEY